VLLVYKLIGDETVVPCIVFASNIFVIVVSPFNVIVPTDVPITTLPPDVNPVPIFINPVVVLPNMLFVTDVAPCSVTAPVCVAFPIINVPLVRLVRILEFAVVVFVKRLFTPVIDVPYIVVFAVTAVVDEFPIVKTPDVLAVLIFIADVVELLNRLFDPVVNAPLIVTLPVCAVLPIVIAPDVKFDPTIIEPVVKLLHKFTVVPEAIL